VAVFYSAFGDGDIEFTLFLKIKTFSTNCHLRFGGGFSFIKRHIFPPIIAFCSKLQPICCQFTQRADKNIRNNYKKIFKSAKLPQIPADIIDVRAIKALSRKRIFRECFAKQTPDGKSLAQSLSHKNKQQVPIRANDFRKGFRE